MVRSLTDFRTSLTRVRDITQDIDANVAAALSDSNVRERHQTMLCSVTVILSGFLESFIRNVAEEAINDVCRRAIPFDNLPAKVRTTHYVDGGRWLQEIAKSEKNDNPLTHSRAANGARRLASVTGALPYEIVWEAFSDTRANPGPETISDFLKKFDVSDPLPTLAAAAGTTQNTLTTRLRSFIEVRNECAHTGNSSSLTTTSVRDYCDLLEDIGKSVVSVFNDRFTRPPF